MPKSKAPAARFKYSGRVAWRKVADEAIILDVETAAYFSLAGSGLRMWELLGQGRTAPEVAQALAGEYDADEARIARDCERLVEKLRKKGLLVRK